MIDFLGRYTKQIILVASAAVGVIAAVRWDDRELRFLAWVPALGLVGIGLLSLLERLSSSHVALGQVTLPPDLDSARSRTRALLLELGGSEPQVDREGNRFSVTLPPTSLRSPGELVTISLEEDSLGVVQAAIESRFIRPMLFDAGVNRSRVRAMIDRLAGE